MRDRLATIHLHGPLGERFGTPHHLAVSSPMEAVAALDANYPGFLATFAKYEAYGIHADGDWRGGDDAGRMPFSRDLHFCPIIEGRAFLGAALVGALFPAISATTATIIGGVLMAGVMFGLSFLLTSKTAAEDASDKDQNYAFSGPENVSGQGVAVPLIYGRVYAGSVVISAGLDVGTDLATTTPVAAPPAAAPSTTTPSGVTPPPGGWPAIVYDNLGRPGPQGWHIVGTTNAISARGASSAQVGKEVDLWQHPTATRYFYNMVRGFYYSADAKTQPLTTDYERPRGGGHS